MRRSTSNPSRAGSPRSMMTRSASRDRMDEPLTLAVIAELATEPVHGHADDIAGRGVVEAPDVSRQCRCRYDRVAVPHQVLQQAELGARETGRHPIEVERAF